MQAAGPGSQPTGFTSAARQLNLLAWLQKEPDLPKGMKKKKIDNKHSTEIEITEAQKSGRKNKVDPAAGMEEVFSIF